MRLIAAALSAAAALWAAVQAEEPPPFVAPQTIEELDAAITKALEGASTVGLQIALVDETGAYWTRNFGHLDKEKTRAVEDDSIFRAGSISKSFTGVLAQMLVEDGVLDLNAKLRDVVPEIEFANKWEETDPVRLVNLAEHTTGWDDIQFSEYRSFAPDISILDGLRVNPKARTARWRPGRYGSYNNAGPSALAGAMEKLTGKSYEALIDERIMGPLGIENASFFLTEGVAAKISKSYSATGGLEPYAYIGMRPAGSLNISAKELAKFVAFLIRRGEANGAQLLAPESVDRVETPTTSLGSRAGLSLGYGLGVYGFNVKNHLFRGHNGGIDGFLSEYGYLKASRKGYVIMSNTADGAPLLAVRDLVASYLYASSGEQAPLATPVIADLKQYEGHYRQLTPNAEFIRPLLDALDVVTVTAEDGGLVLASPTGDKRRLIPLGDGKFAREGRSEADRIFLTTPEGDLELHNFFQSAYRRVPASEIYMRQGVLAATALASVLAILFTVMWALARPFGAFRNSNRWAVWTWPLLSIVAIAVAILPLAMSMSAGSAISADRLGGPTPWSLATQFGTYAIPLFAVFGVIAALRSQGVSGFARAHAGLTSLILLGFSALLWTYGWIGMTIWSYRPVILGS